MLLPHRVCGVEMRGRVAFATDPAILQRSAAQAAALSQSLFEDTQGVILSPAARSS